MSQTIDVGNEFFHRLANRDEQQGDGTHNAVEFRHMFLEELDEESSWNTDDVFITLDFQNVNKISPSFANEAFAYFIKFKNATTDRVLSRIKLINITNVKLALITRELKNANIRK